MNPLAIRDPKAEPADAIKNVHLAAGHAYAGADRMVRCAEWLVYFRFVQSR